MPRIEVSPDELNGCECRVSNVKRIPLYSQKRKLRGGNQVTDSKDLMVGRTYHGYCDATGSSFYFTVERVENDSITARVHPSLESANSGQRVRSPEEEVRARKDHEGIELSFADFGLMPYKDGRWNIVNYITTNGSSGIEVKAA